MITTEYAIFTHMKSKTDYRLLSLAELEDGTKVAVYQNCKYPPQAAWNIYAKLESSGAYVWLQWVENKFVVRSMEVPVSEDVKSLWNYTWVRPLAEFSVKFKPKDDDEEPICNN